MSLELKVLLVRSTSGADKVAVKNYIDNWMSNLDLAASQDEDKAGETYFALVIDLKHKETYFSYSPAAVSTYSIADTDNPTYLSKYEEAVEGQTQSENTIFRVPYT